APSLPGAPTIQFYSPDPGAIVLPGQQVPAYYTCTSAISIVVSCVGSVPLLAPVDTSTPGDHQLTVTAIDLEGRQTVASLTYTFGSTPVPSYSCADASGEVSCQATPLDTTSAGAKTFTVTAKDRSGNTATASRSYSVVYPFGGFEAPIVAYPGSNTARAGDAV